MSVKYLVLVFLFVVTHCICSNTAVATDPGNGKQYEMPESCTGKAYCFEKGNNYPDEEVSKLLNHMPFGPPLPAASGPYGGSGSTYDEDDCLSSSTDDPIYYITDSDNKVRVVIQNPEIFNQTHTVKWCTNEGPIQNDTTHFTPSTLENHHIECVSSKINIGFYVLSESLNQMEIVTVKIPVCCLCKYNLVEDNL